MRVRKLILGAAVAMAGMAFVGSAKADTLAIEFSEDGGAFGAPITTAGFSAAGLSFSGSYGDFSITLNSTIAKNGANLSDLLGSTLQVENTGSGTHTLDVRISETGYTMPAGTLLNVESGMGGSVVAGTTLGLTDIFQGYADSTNTLFGTGGFTTGPQNATLSGTTFDTGSAVGVFARTGDYSLTSDSILKVSAGGTVNYGNHMNVTAAPLPTSASTGLALLAGLGVLGGVSVLRRRRQMA